jgi:predicted Rossmann fold flavoprotein
MSSLPQQVDVVVIGAGASGLMCAITAGYRGRSVLLLEHSNKAGRKILMSGGGRCNFTHMFSTPANFLSSNPHFCKSALSRYKPQDFVDMVDRHGIDYHEKTPGQLFCDVSSKEILQMLLTEADWAGVQLEIGCAIEQVDPQASGYKVATARGVVDCESLVIATGGLSIPNGGATGFAYELAERFGMAVTDRRAALVPFTLQPDLLTPLKELSGVAQPARVSCNGMSFKEPILFTHRGISGPSVLQISSYWAPGSTVEIDLLPDLDLAELLKNQRGEHPRWSLERSLSEHMSKRTAQVLCEIWQLSGELTQLSNERIDEIARAFKHWQVKPSGTEGYRTAEVTIGGIETNEVSQRTFEAKKAPGLFFIGECLDVTGHLGGHNFQWAWASGFCCGQAV